MSRQLRELSRAAVALVVAAAYVLPPSLGLLADASHGLHHAVEQVREHQQLAAALGLVHEPRERATLLAPPTAEGFAHTHGGSTHAHDAATDALLQVAAGHAGQTENEARAPGVKLSTHVPVLVARFASAQPTFIGSGDVVLDLAGRHGPAPVPPPPRA